MNHGGLNKDKLNYLLYAYDAFLLLSIYFPFFFYDKANGDDPTKNLRRLALLGAKGTIPIFATCRTVGTN